jgi:hypothetical protein
VALYAHDNADLADDEGAWQQWAEGIRNTDERIAELGADLGGRTSRLAKVASRLFSSPGHTPATDS